MFAFFSVTSRERDMGDVIMYFDGCFVDGHPTGRIVLVGVIRPKGGTDTRDRIHKLTTEVIFLLNSLLFNVNLRSYLLARFMFLLRYFPKTTIL